MVSPTLIFLGVLLAGIGGQRISELRLAKRNLEWALENGGRLVDEPHYWMFFVLHTAWLLAWPTEAWLRGPERAEYWWVFLVGFGLAEALRYWAIASLGKRWNTKIVVMDEQPLVERGPYRFLSHPNYLAVAMELVCVPLISNAWITAAVCTVLNAALLLGLRIPAENAALREASETACDGDSVRGAGGTE
ncbi:isoprenylcysteine carboxyl methyltransferase family protein [Enhygromyxa salina]|uniref:Isoprenylcysteine carboxyl methyltransferase (ICMT) family protein n=1 Tax=Enhygromyxa salina TaxID=215803 RepID=A0A2S9XLC0_9BACT|nr:isoprenylcysteine carboxylmethyltransferase family protein [Enhygromyxa salina]PRP93530.1 Isoprenylcysteine carboxyl methyltransferase (ICMT) family protein [Enhygromyxa salina]